MEAIRYIKSVPRYLTARWLGRRWPRVYTSRLGVVELADIPEQPLPSPEWVRIRPLLSGICGSDLATITAQGSAYFSPLSSAPFVFGHEVVGRVAETGRQAGNFQIGERVILEPPLHCRIRKNQPVCMQCQAGRRALCEKVTEGIVSAGIQTGFCRDTGGGWSESFVAHHLQLHRAPEALSDEAAVLAEPLSCCLHAVRKAALDDFSRVLVIGCGAMGLLTIAAVRLVELGCHITAVARHPHQQREARMQGSDQVSGSMEPLDRLAAELGVRLFPAEIGRPTGLGGVDVCFDCVGSERTIDTALRLTRAGGRVVLVGMPAIPRGVDWTAIWHKELIVEGSYTSSPDTFREAIELAERNPDRLQGLVGKAHALGDFREAIHRALHTGRSGTVKTVFRINN